MTRLMRPVSPLSLPLMIMTYKTSAKDKIITSTTVNNDTSEKERIEDYIVASEDLPVPD